MDFTLGSAYAQNFIKICEKIIYYMWVLFVSYIPIHIFQLLNLNNFKIKKMDTLIKNGPRRQELYKINKSTSNFCLKVPLNLTF